MPSTQRSQRPGALHCIRLRVIVVGGLASRPKYGVPSASWPVAHRMPRSRILVIRHDTIILGPIRIEHDHEVPGARVQIINAAETRRHSFSMRASPLWFCTSLCPCARSGHRDAGGRLPTQPARHLAENLLAAGWVAGAAGRGDVGMQEPDRPAPEKPGTSQRFTRGRIGSFGTPTTNGAFARFLVQVVPVIELASAAVSLVDA